MAAGRTAPRNIDGYIAAFPPEVQVKAISPYAGEKGNLRFPLDRPIPYGLIKRIVKLRVRQNLTKAAAKGKKGR